LRLRRPVATAIHTASECETQKSRAEQLGRELEAEVAILINKNKDEIAAIQRESQAKVGWSRGESKRTIRLFESLQPKAAYFGKSAGGMFSAVAIIYVLKRQHAYSDS
jgi:pantothenate synthetase